MIAKLISKQKEKSKEKIVVVGNGMVGYHFCRQLKEIDRKERFDITVFGKETQPAYDRVNLTDFVNHRSARQLYLAEENWYEQQNISLHLNDPVLKIDPDSKQIVSQAGHIESYDHLVLATGSVPFIPPVFNHAHREGQFVYRTISDIEQILEYSQKCESAAVIGGGLLGLEAAKVLHDLGKEVHVVEIAHYLMPQQLDPRAGELLEDTIRSMGIQIHTKSTTSHIHSSRHGTHQLVFDDEDRESLLVDMIVVSVGIKSSNELARETGLKCDPMGWIHVDDTLQASTEDIYAIGECVNHNGENYGLVAPGYQMADILAKRLVGKKATFTKGDRSTRLKVMGIEVTSLGDSLQSGETYIFETEGNYRKLVARENRLIGAMFLGPNPEVPLIQNAIQSNRKFKEKHFERFLREGFLCEDKPGGMVQSWPNEAAVCNCMNISKGTLCEAMEQGCKTVEKLMDRTGAATICGSCKPLLVQMTGVTMTVKPPIAASLLVGVSLISLLALVATVFTPEMKFSLSVQKMWYTIDALWRSSFLKQVSGFSLLGLSAVAMIMSLRKRVKWFSFGEFASWRFLHGFIGMTTLIALFVHTGFNFGANLNFILMIAFALLNLLGAFAGIASGLENKTSSRVGEVARKYRSMATGLHIACFWPLPVLIGFHIFSVYYW